MTYYWLGSPAPRIVERIYTACITQHDETLDLVLPYPEPETATEMRANLDCIYKKYDWILNGGIPDVGDYKPYKISPAVWESLLEHRTHLERLLDKYGDQVVQPTARICSIMWKAVRPYLRTKWRSSSAGDWNRKETIGTLLLHLQKYPKGFPLDQAADLPLLHQANNATTTLPPYEP